MKLLLEELDFSFYNKYLFDLTIMRLYVKPHIRCKNKYYFLNSKIKLNEMNHSF